MGKRINECGADIRSFVVRHLLTVRNYLDNVRLPTPLSLRGSNRTTPGLARGAAEAIPARVARMFLLLLWNLRLLRRLQRLAMTRWVVGRWLLRISTVPEQNRLMGKKAWRSELRQKGAVMKQGMTAALEYGKHSEPSSGKRGEKAGLMT